MPSSIANWGSRLLSLSRQQASDLLPVATPESDHHGMLACSSGRSINCNNNSSAAAPQPTTTTTVSSSVSTMSMSKSAVSPSLSLSVASSLLSHHHPLSPPTPSSCPSSTSPSSSSTSSSSSSSPSPSKSPFHQQQTSSSLPPTISATAIESSATTEAAAAATILETSSTSIGQTTSTTTCAAGSTPQPSSSSPCLSRVSSTSSFFKSAPPPDRPAPPPPRPPLTSNSTTSLFTRRPSLNPFRASHQQHQQQQPTTVADPSLPPPPPGPTLAASSLKGKKKKSAKATIQGLFDSLAHSLPHSHSTSPSHSSHSQSPPCRQPSTHSRTPSLSGSIRSIRSIPFFSTANFSPSGSLKGSIKEKAGSLFSIKRRRRLPIPLWTGNSSSSSSSNTDQEAPNPPPRPRPRLSNASIESFSIDYPTSTSNSTTMQQVEYMPNSTQNYPLQQAYDGPSFHHDAPSLPAHGSSSSTSTLSTLQKQTLSSKRMRPPLSEISTANIPSSSTTLISSDVNQQQAYPHLPSSSSSHVHKSTTTPNNPNQGSNTEDEADHLHECARFVSPSSLTEQRQQQSLSSPASGLVTTATISPTSNAVSTPTLANDPSQRTALHGQNETSPLSEKTWRMKSDKKATLRAHLSRDARTIRSRIRRLWMDPSQEDHTRTRRDPKNHYLQLEDSLTQILQIVPPIIENARIPQSGPLGLSYPAAFSDSPSNHNHPRIMPMSMDFSAATGSVISHSSPPTPSLVGSALSISSGGSTNNSTATTTTIPVHTRARTTSTSSTSTINATRYQIATSILQPPEPPLTDVTQPTIRTPTNGASLGEPSLSTIAAAAAASNSPSSLMDSHPSPPRMAVSNEILISKLLNLSKTFTGSIRALCEQQNEKVLRFDDDMILGVLRRWEQEAGKEEEEESVSEPDNSSTTSLITLGATNALERYQIIVGRVWEETDVILSCIRKIRDLVEFGRVQHYSDFDDDDSEEDAIERDEVMKKSLYSRLLFHAHGLVTVLGECLECVSGIQRLVSTSKTQRKSMENTRDEFFLNGTATAFDNNEYEGDGCRSPSIVSLSMEEPRPVRHLDPALMRKLKRKTKFKTITEKMRQSFSDFAKRSTNSLLSVFPPLGDGTNEGFHWDSYSDGEYYSEEWVGTEFGGSFLGDEDSFFRTMSPPESPIFKSEKFYSRHRRLSSKDSSSVPDQYWPGSIRLGFSDDGMSPTTSSHPITPLSPPPSLDPTVGYFSGAVVGGASMARSTSSERTPNTIASRFHISSPTNGPSMNKKSLESLRESFGMTRQLPVEGDSIMGPSLPTSPTRPEGKEKRQSLLFRRKSIQAPSFTGVSISTPVPVASRPLSVYSSSGESQTPSRNNYRVRPPRPPNSLPPMPPSPTQRDSLENSFGSESAGSTSVYASYQPRQSNRTSSYLATRSISPQQSSPLILNSPFTRKTSIRMGMDRNRYSVRMPEDDQSDQLMSFITDNHSSAHGSNGINNSPRNSNFSGSFWRRRSYNDAVEKNWQSLLQESFVPSISGASDISTPSTPSGRLEKRSTVGLDSSSSPRSSAQLASFEFLIPFFSREGNSVSSSASSRQGSRPGSGSLLSRSGSERMMMLGNNRRHSSPLTLGAERALADALNPRLSVSSQQSQSSTDSQPHQPQQQGSTNRSSDQKMPTVDEKKSHSAPHQRQNQDVGSTVKSRLETDPLSIPPRPKSTYRKESQESTASSNSSDGTRYHAPYVSGKTMAGVPMESNSNYREPGSVDRRGIPIDLDRKPVVSPRFGDMKKAWEILNLDVKRINQYSHLRAYAKAQTAQNNLWALRHPNALQSTTSPSVLHIGENGTHVLVMEMFAGHLQVVAGLLEKLIERLADENAQDAEYVSCFLLSHSFFIDSEDLLDRLMARFHIQPRQGEIIYFEKWQTVIQVKILCVLQRWITIQYEDFELNPNLLKTLKKFLEVDVRESGFVMEAECIEKNVSIKNLSPIKNCSVIMEQGRFCLQRSRTRKVSLTRSLNRTGSGSPPSQMSTLEPALPSPTEQLIEYGPTPELAASSPILQLNGQDLARYLTLADMKAFRSITVFELMSGWWKRRQAAENRRSSVGDGDDGAEPKSPSGLNVAGIDGAEDGAIEAFTRRANMLSYWVAHEIVSTAGSKARKQLIKKFIEVAKICRTLNNLHTAMFIVSALTSKPVRRLSSTWKLVSNRDMETLRGLEALMDPSGNMRSYRQAIADAEAPIIPFLPILLKDITFILDGNPTMITSKTNLPNQVDPVSTSSPVSAPLPIPATSADTTTDNETATISSSTTETATTTPKDNGAPLVNFDKFRRLTQYVENAVDMAKSVDYSFEHQLLRQARVFRPTSPSLYGETDSLHGSSGGTSSLMGGRSGSSHGNSHGNGNHPAPDGSRGALDHISEIVERRLVKASGLYGVHQRVIQVEFVTRAPSSKSSVGSSSLPWKAAGGDHHSGGGGSNIGSIHGSMVGYGSGRSVGDTVIRAVQGEEEYLMGLSRMCEPVR